MLNLKRSFIVGLALLVGLFAISSVALAEHADDHPEDTLFSFGYDEANHFLAINIDANDVPYECIFENGTLTATYGDETDGKIAVDTLEDEFDVVKSFDARDGEELGEGVDPAPTATVDYTGTDGECAVYGVILAGPNGQINHGQFMKAAKSLFNSLYDIQGQGCIVRHLAKSDIGKGETQLTVSEAEALEFEFDESGEGGDIDFTTVEADCNRGKKDKGSDAENANKGQSGSKGKSGDAPGHNK